MDLPFLFLKKKRIFLLFSWTLNTTNKKKVGLQWWCQSRWREPTLDVVGTRTSPSGRFTRVGFHSNDDASVNQRWRRTRFGNGRKCRRVRRRKSGDGRSQRDAQLRSCYHRRLEQTTSSGSRTTWRFKHKTFLYFPLFDPVPLLLSKYPSMNAEDLLADGPTAAPDDSSSIPLYYYISRPISPLTHESARDGKQSNDQRSFHYSSSLNRKKQKRRREHKMDDEERVYIIGVRGGPSGAIIQNVNASEPSQLKRHTRSPPPSIYIIRFDKDWYYARPRLPSTFKKNDDSGDASDLMAQNNT